MAWGELVGIESLGIIPVQTLTHINAGKFDIAHDQTIFLSEKNHGIQEYTASPGP